MADQSLMAMAQRRRAALLEGNIISPDPAGIIPFEQKNSVTSRIPLLVILQRLIDRLQPGTSLDTLLGLIALYTACQPVYTYLKEFFYDTFTSQIQISDRHAAGREVLAYMADKVMCEGNTTRAVLVSVNGSHDEGDVFNGMMMARYNRLWRNGRTRGDRAVQFMPSLGQKRWFWYVWLLSCLRAQIPALPPNSPPI
jgi:hypothetical protein